MSSIAKSPHVYDDVRRRPFIFGIGLSTLLALALMFSATSSVHADAPIAITFGDGEIDVSWIDDNEDSHTGYVVQWRLSELDFDPTISDMELDSGWWDYNGVKVLSWWGSGRYAEVYSNGGSHWASVWLDDDVVEYSPTYNQLSYAQLWAQNAIRDYYDEYWLYASSEYVTASWHTITGLTSEHNYVGRVRAAFGKYQNGTILYDNTFGATFSVLLPSAENLGNSYELIATPGDGKFALSMTDPHAASRIGYYVQWRESSTDFDPVAAVMELDSDWWDYNGVKVLSWWGSGRYAEVYTNSDGSYSATVWLGDDVVEYSPSYDQLSYAQLWAQNAIRVYLNEPWLYARTQWVTQPSYTITGLTNGYYYVAQMYALGGPSSDIAHGVFSHQPSVPPSAPSIKTVYPPESSSRKVSWYVPGDNGTPIHEYIVQWEEYDGGDLSWLNANEDTVPADRDYYTMTGLTEGATYFFRVRAINVLDAPGEWSRPKELYLLN